MSDEMNGHTHAPEDWNENHMEDGMSLRDYFAAQALVGMLAQTRNAHVERTVHTAYMIADAMLIAREADHEE